MQQLVIGAGSTIAQALIQQSLQQGDSVVAVSRQTSSYEEFPAGSRLRWLHCGNLASPLIG
jgi:NAD(P)-dependent dehydrogenase (short-subunit alcohol dehydrogenase family)